MEEKPKRERKLTDKQKAYCEKYAECLNKMEAYRSTYNATKMKSSSINNAVKELSKNPLIEAYVKELMGKTSSILEYKIEQSLKEDLDMIERYKKHLDVLENPKSREAEIIASKRTMKFIGHSAFSSAQERVSKKLGFYEKDKTKATVVYTVAVSKEEAKEIAENLNGEF